MYNVVATLRLLSGVSCGRGQAAVACRSLLHPNGMSRLWLEEEIQDRSNSGTDYGDHAMLTPVPRDGSDPSRRLE